MTNFTAQDSIGCLRAIVAFSLLLFSPGYLLGTVTNLLGFRDLRFPEQAAWSVALSFGAATFLNILIGRQFSISLAATTFALGCIPVALRLVLDRGKLRHPTDRYTRYLALYALFASVIVIAELVDVQIGRNLFPSVTLLDQAYRVSWVAAVAHTGIPPANPMFYPGHAEPLRYYYFWYALCATAMRLAHATARQVLIASSVWCGIGLLAMIALFARHFLQVRQRCTRYILAASLLLAVTGADLLPVIVNLLSHQPYGGDPEWWSTDQVSSWLDSVLWVPNHTAALICALTAFLLLWRTQEELTRSQRLWATILSGVAGATAFGLSIYVAAGFGMLIVSWSVRLLLAQSYKLVMRNAAGALTAVLLLLPWLLELVRQRSGTLSHGAAAAEHLLAPGVRIMIDPNLVTNLPRLAFLNRAHPVLLDQLVRLILLVPGYAVELGVFGAVLVLAIHRYSQLNANRRAALFLILAGMVPVSLLRSSVGQNNDFGYRAVMLPCFFLTLLGADLLLQMWDERKAVGWPGQRILFATLLGLGLATTIFQAASLRFFIPLQAFRQVPGFAGLPAAVFEERSAFEQARLPSDAVVQLNPTRGGDFFYMAGWLYAERQMVVSAADDDCGAVYGGDPRTCVATEHQIRALFALPALSATQAMATCHEFGAQYLAASTHDPAWQEADAWIWELPAVADTGGVRVVNCTGIPQAKLP
jgi:hypothetical protein